MVVAIAISTIWLSMSTLKQLRFSQGYQIYRARQQKLVEIAVRLLALSLLTFVSLAPPTHPPSKDFARSQF